MTFNQSYSETVPLKTSAPFEIKWGLVKTYEPYLNRAEGLSRQKQDDKLKTVLDRPFQVTVKLQNISDKKCLVLKDAAMFL